MVSSSIGWTTEALASEGEPAVPPTSAKNFPMEPEGIDAARGGSSGRDCGLGS